jgi:hypothetical protein
MPRPPEPEQPAPPVPAPASDGAIVDLLGTIFSRWSTLPERRAAASSHSLLDPRGVAPLVYLLGDADPQMRAQAAYQLGHMPLVPPLDPRVEIALIEVAQRPTEIDDVRVAAIQALQAIGGDKTGAALHEVYIASEQSDAVRNAARTALAARWPDQLKAQGPIVVDRAGRQGLIMGASLLGAYTLGAVGALGKNDAGVTIGVLGGAVTGGVTAAYLTRSGEITAAQAGWMVTAGMWGASLGMTTAASIQRDPSERIVLSLGLAGEGLAFTAAAMTRKTMRYSAADITEINVAGLLGIDLALGGLLLREPRDDRRAAYGVITGASVAGLTTGLLLAPRIKITERDGTLLALSAYEATFLGLLAPTAWFDPSDEGRATGAGGLLGFGLGIAGATAVAQYTELQPRDLGMTFVFGTFGKLLGWSVPLLTKAERSPHDQRGLFLGSIAGLAGGAAIAPELRDMTAGDGWLVTLGSVLGGWHGLGLSIAADEDGDKVGGWSTLGLSIGGLGTIGLSRVVKIEAKEAQALAGGFFWGTWFAAWTAALKDIDVEPALRMTIAAGDAGLAIGGLLVSPVANIDPRRVGIAYLGGVSGSALASLGVALVTRDDNKLIGANLIGSAAGLGLGAIIASQWKFATPAPKTTSAPKRPGLLALSAPMLSPVVMAPAPGSTVPGFGVAATFFEQ